ncbi:MAG: hypothetical protein VYC40_05770, partial [Pseudomonadota bacterium]|nr:hypothetical protein [Pseudomonadota bacterium]
IDPEMVDEMHVTVVVTGLDQSVHNDDNLEGRKTVQDKLTAMRSSSLDKSSNSEWRSFDRPTISRIKSTDNEAARTKSSSEESDSKYLDIPAFLRRQEIDEPSE